MSDSVPTTCSCPDNHPVTHRLEWPDGRVDFVCESFASLVARACRDATLTRVEPVDRSGDQSPLEEIWRFLMSQGRITWADWLRSVADEIDGGEV
jgi:hypothetical protein